MSRPLRWYDYITINILFFGLTVLSQTNGLIFPLLVQGFVGEAAKGAYLGRLRLGTLMVALLWQAVIGMMSDRSTLRWGRRRPFIFIGALAVLAFIVLIGMSAGMTGLTGFWFLFTIAILQSLAANTAHGAQQGLIPDLVPEDRRGRFSGAKAVLEAPLPLILISFTIAPLISERNLWGSLGWVMIVVFVVMLLTLLAPEKRLAQAPAPFNWSPILRLTLMTVVFTVIILGTAEAVRRVDGALENITVPAVLLAIVGGVGLLAMVLAVAVGVWISVRISIGGEAARGNPAFTWWVVNRLAYLVGTTNLGTFAIYFLQGRLDLVGEQAAYPAARLMMIIGICILGAALPGGWLADKFEHKRMVAVAGLLAALGVFIALILPNITAIYIGGGMIGIATGLFFTANWALGTGLAPQAEAGRYLGISNLAGAGAGAVGAYIGGPLADFITARLPGLPGAGYSLLFGIYGAMFLVSVAALHGVRPTRAPR